MDVFDKRSELSVSSVYRLYVKELDVYTNHDRHNRLSESQSSIRDGYNTPLPLESKSGSLSSSVLL
jgi:hypothetical protein